MKNFRSLLAIAAIATSVSASITPAQALTWDEVWGAVKQGIQSREQQQQQSSSNNSEAPQQQQQQQPQQQGQTASQSNAEQSSAAPQAIRRMPRQMLASNCVKVSGSDTEFIDRDNQGSMISVGRRAVNVNSKVGLWGSSYEMTCAIQRHPSSGKARFAYVIADDSNLESMRVSIIVDGQERSTGIIHRGQGRGFVVDISRARSYAVVLKAINYGGGYVHFPNLSPAAYY
jgi:hypothetical protein